MRTDPPPSRRRARWTWLALLCAAACGSSNTLNGSISEILPIGFSSTAFYSDGSNLIVEYRSGPDLVCKLVIDALHSGATAGTTLAGNSFTQYVSLTRVTAKGDQFPDLLSGSLKLTAFSLARGETVSGSFVIVFNQGSTMTGAFSGDVTTQ